MVPFLFLFFISCDGRWVSLWCRVAVIDCRSPSHRLASSLNLFIYIFNLVLSTWTASDRPRRRCFARLVPAFAKRKNKKVRPVPVEGPAFFSFSDPHFFLSLVCCSKCPPAKPGVARNPRGRYRSTVFKKKYKSRRSR